MGEARRFPARLTPGSGNPGRLPTKERATRPLGDEAQQKQRLGGQSGNGDLTATSPSGDKEGANVSRPASGSHSCVLSFTFPTPLASKAPVLPIQRPAALAPLLPQTVSSPTEGTAEGLPWVKQLATQALTAGRRPSSPEPGSQPLPSYCPDKPHTTGEGDGLGVPQGRSSRAQRCPLPRRLLWPEHYPQPGWEAAL